MHNTFSQDPVCAAFALRKEKKSFDWLFLLACTVVFGFTFFMFFWQFQFRFTDLRVHAEVAGAFDFTDLHSITSRLAYPMWHLFVAIVYQLGVPLIWASAFVCAAAKTLGMFLVWLLLRVVTQGRISRPILALAAFLLMFITCLRLPWFNPNVYGGVGSPTAWHNPTQLMANLSMFLCVPYLVHCWMIFERRLPQMGSRALLPWYNAVILAVLLMFSLACKPTFMQAFLPAAAVFFLIKWIQHPRNSRYFLQIILCFLPAALYFLLQYLYYTGVVVPYTSGVVFGATLETAWSAIRGMLLMTAFPLSALLCCKRKELSQDKMLTLTLLMMVISVLETMFFRETGLRLGHGNFNWACMNAALLFWVLMTGHFLRSFRDFLKSEKKPPMRKVAFGLSFALLLWHVYSSGYYIFFLFSNKNAF